MLSGVAIKYDPTCINNAGGISRAWLFDAADFDFTTGVDPATYSAVALMAGATLIGGSGFHPIKFNHLEGEYKATHTQNTNSSNEYAHTVSLQVQILGSELTNFMDLNQKLSACGRLGIVLELNNGKIIVIGESIVNAVVLPVFKVRLDGTELGSGKGWGDNNGATLSFKGMYNRAAYEFTGGSSAIIALQAA